MHYYGYYNNELLVYSDNKELVKSYLQKTRKLSKDEYEIKEESDTPVDKLQLYSAVNISDDIGIITIVDVKILDTYYKKSMEYIRKSVDNISDFIAFLKDHELFEEDAYLITDIINEWNEKFYKDKVLTKMKKKIVKNSPLFAPIDKYLRYRKSYLLDDEMNKEYKYFLDETE